MVKRKDTIEHWQEITVQALVGCLVAFVASSTFILLALFLSPVFLIPCWIAIGAQVLALSIAFFALRQRYKIYMRRSRD